MTALAQLQQRFVESLINPRFDSEFLNQCQSIIQTVEDRFSIYRFNHQTNLTKALVSIYAVCQRLLGSRFFNQLARLYIKQYPSYNTNLNDYGSAFSTFIAHFPLVSHLPYLETVAEFEWIVHQILLGEESYPFDWTSLAKLDPAHYDDLILHRLQNSVLYYSPYPVDRIWAVNQPDFLGDDRVDLGEGERYLFVWRMNYDLRIDTLTKAQWTLLNLIDGRQSIGQFANSKVVKDLNIDLLAQLPLFIKKGYITHFTKED